MSGGASTRSATKTHLADLVGKPQELPQADLPTKRGILQMMLLVRLEDPRDYRKVPIMELARKVGRAVSSIWLKCNSKLVGAVVKEKEVERRVFMLWNRMEGVASGGKKKAKGKRKKYGNAGKEREEFVKDLDQLSIF